MTASIKLQDISVFGVDTHARAATFRQWFTRRTLLRPVRIPILTHLDFEAKPGDRIGIMGINGSGKSSLLKVISGNYPIHSGVRDVQGTIVPLIEMGIGFEHEISGRSNIKLSYAYRGKLRQYSKKLEEEIIEFSELGDKIDAPIKSYSNGMLSRLAFSSAIFQEPDILLLDEVLATGDPGFMHKSAQAVKKKVDKAAITIVVSHIHDQMMALCNRFLLMHQGKIINEGSADEIRAQYRRDILHLTD